MVYGRILALHGPLYAGAQILRRAWQLYVAHIFLFVIFFAEVSYTVTTFNNPMYNDEMRVGEFLTESHIAVVKALLLQFQPTYLDILALYVVLLGFFRSSLLLCGGGRCLSSPPRRRSTITVQVGNISVPAYGRVGNGTSTPWHRSLLFVAGAALGLKKTAWRCCRAGSAGLLGSAAVTIATAVVVRLSRTIHGLFDPVPGILLAACDCRYPSCTLTPIGSVRGDGPSTKPICSRYGSFRSWPRSRSLPS